MSSFICLAVAVVIMNAITGCANMVPPSGGPRDSLPPLIESADPVDSALNVNTQKITINFDEFIELKSPSEQILISPYPEKMPQYEARLRTLTIRLKDSLLPSTTYVIDFGQAIVDLNEGNVRKDLRYVFSTGNRLDTLTLEGVLIPAQTGKADSTLLAVLYRKEEDSLVCKKTPAYVSRLDGNGRFRFYNLPQGDYYVYGIEDRDGNKKYNPPYEQFAFLDRPVTVDGNNLPVRLWAYHQEKEAKRAPATGAAAKKLSFTTSIEGGAHNHYDTLLLRYDKPLSLIDASRIRLKEDSAVVDEPFTLIQSKDPRQVLLAASWKKGGNYKLYFDTAYAKDTSGFRPTLRDTFAFRIRTDKDYGSLRLRFSDLDLSKNPVLLFYVGDKVVYSFPLARSEFFRPLFPPGSYTIGILYDQNSNGRWDPGSYFVLPRRQPERVVPLDKTISVKSDWDNEAQVDVKAE